MVVVMKPEAEADDITAVIARVESVSNASRARSYMIFTFSM